MRSSKDLKLIKHIIDRFNKFYSSPYGQMMLLDIHNYDLNIRKAVTELTEKDCLRKYDMRYGLTVYRFNLDYLVVPSINIYKYQEVDADDLYSFTDAPFKLGHIYTLYTSINIPQHFTVNKENQYLINTEHQLDLNKLVPVFYIECESNQHHIDTERLISIDKYVIYTYGYDFDSQLRKKPESIFTEDSLEDIDKLY